MNRLAFPGLKTADLIVDAIYESDRNSTTVGSEPLAPLTGTGNQGGFRFSGRIAMPELVVLYTTMSEADWPDAIDEENGLFYYYGDNRRPGFELHDRKSGRGGNQILRNVFEWTHGDPSEKPWPAIIEAVLAGRIGLYRAGRKGLDVRSCLISRPDMRTLHALRVLSAEPGTRSEWLSEADARERLSTTGQRMRSLVEAKRLSTSGSYAGLTYRRSEVDAIAVAWVSTPELRIKLDQCRRDLSTTLRAAGLIVDERTWIRSPRRGPEETWASSRLTKICPVCQRVASTIPYR